MFVMPECDLEVLRKSELVITAISLSQEQGFDLSKDDIGKLSRKQLMLAIRRRNAPLLAEMIQIKRKTRLPQRVWWNHPYRND